MRARTVAASAVAGSGLAALGWVLSLGLAAPDPRAGAATSFTRDASAAPAPPPVETPPPPVRETDDARVRGRVRFTSNAPLPAGRLVLDRAGGLELECGDGTFDVKAPETRLREIADTTAGDWTYLVHGDPRLEIAPDTVVASVDAVVGELLLDVVLPDGWFLFARLRPARGVATPARALWARGQVEPADEDAPDPITFAAPRPLAVDAAGRCGPTFVEVSPAGELTLEAGGGVRVLRCVPPEDLTSGATWDLGTFDLPTPTGVEVRLANARVEEGLALDVTRLRGDDPEADAFVRALAALDPLLADAVYGDGTLPLDRSRPRRLVPLAGDAGVRLVIVAPTGARSRATDVPITPGEVREVTLDAAALFPDVDLEGVRLDGTLRWSDTETPIPHAVVREATTGRETTADASGRFALEALPRDVDLRFEIRALESENPERVDHRLLRLDAGGRTERSVAWTVSRTRWLLAGGLVPPAGHDAPLAFALETCAPGGRWRITAADVFRSTGTGVEISLTATDVAARAVAIWSPLLVQHSLPAGVLEETRHVASPFEAISPAPTFVEGRVTTRDGAAVANAAIEAMGPIGGLPPWRGVTGRDGRFVVGPTNVPELTLVCSTSHGTAEVTVVPAEEVPVEMVIE